MARSPSLSSEFLQRLKEERRKKLSRLSYDKLIELFSGRKNLHFICNEFFLDNCFHCQSKADALHSSRGKVTRLPSVHSDIHACMQKMKEALKLIPRPLALSTIDDDGQFSNRFLLVRQKNSSERVQ